MNTLNAPRPGNRHVKAGIAAELGKYYAELAALDDSHGEFSLARLYGSYVPSMPDATREMEVCQAAALLADQHVMPHRWWVPLAAIGDRAMASTPGSKGGYLATPETRPPADVLRPWSVAASALPLDNLRGSVVIPRVSAAATATWLGAEGSSGPSETPPTLGSVDLTPRTLLAIISVSIQVIRQAQAMEPFLRAQLLRAVGEALDVAFFAGTGASQPLGLLQTAGISTQSGTSLAHAGILAMRQKVLTAGGREDQLQWVGTPAVQELLGARERATGGGQFLWGDSGILGRPANATKNAPASALTVGDFSTAVIGTFGPGIRLDIDPTQNFNSGGLVVRVLLMADVAFVQPAAFCVATSVT
jgi:HK97 family phage major capsid protein